MKKALAIVMALVIALSMSAMAFAANVCGSCGSTFSDAADLEEHLKTCTGTTAAEVSQNFCDRCGKAFANEAEYNKHLQICAVKVCPKCGREFANESDYNDHIEICTYGDTKDYVDLTVKEILTMIIDLVKTSAGQWDAIESVIIRLVDFIENIGKGVVPEADVNGAVADLESALGDLQVPGVSDLLNQLKAKIKAMYAGEKATTVVEETEEETTVVADPPETGSATVGIAAFAAISVAAAAAYVCTKKKA